MVQSISIALTRLQAYTLSTQLMPDTSFHDVDFTMSLITLYIVFSVTAVTCLVTLCLNKFTTIVMPTYLQFIQMPIIEAKLGVVYILTVM